MIGPRDVQGDGRFLGVVTAAACHDLMNLFATFSQALGLMDDCLAADSRTRLLSLGFKGGFEHKERFQELVKMLRSQLVRAIGLTEALGLAAHSLDPEGRAGSPMTALGALLVLCERLLKRRKATAVLAELPRGSGAPTPWPALREADYLGPVLEALLACLPHVPMGSALRLGCGAGDGCLLVTLDLGAGGLSDEARAACLALAGPGVEVVPAAAGQPLTFIFRELPTTPTASRLPGADEAS
ncbi:hypothetical protein [Solidesulfovibrio sp.]